MISFIFWAFKKIISLIIGSIFLISAYDLGVFTASITAKSMNIGGSEFSEQLSNLYVNPMFFVQVIIDLIK